MVQLLLMSEQKLALEILAWPEPRGRMAEEREELKGFLREGWDELVVSAREVVEAEPTADGHLLLGICLQFVGRRAEAEAAYEEATRLGPEDEGLKKLRTMVGRLHSPSVCREAEGEAPVRPPRLFRRVRAWWWQTLLRLVLRLQRLGEKVDEPSKRGEA
jgi:hypothetical protein